MAGWPDYVVVTGAGSEDINGVFAIQEGFFHEDCPVYGSLSDFSLSVCQSPDESGKLHWGWIIGQGGVPAYGSMIEFHQVIGSAFRLHLQGPLCISSRMTQMLLPKPISKKRGKGPAVPKHPTRSWRSPLRPSKNPWVLACPGSNVPS